MTTQKYFVYPVQGKPGHAVALDIHGHGYSVSLCNRYEPEDDEARHQSYYLSYPEMEHHLWRIATNEEQAQILAALDPYQLECLFNTEEYQVD